MGSERSAARQNCPSHLNPRLHSAVEIGDMPDSVASSLVTLVTAWDIEQCGLILDDWTIVSIPNVASNPEHSFFMDPVVQSDAVRQYGDKIIGVYHSHMSKYSTPSDDDLNGWHQELPWRYYIVADRKVDEYMRDNDGKPTRVWSGPTTNLACSQP